MRIRIALTLPREAVSVPLVRRTVVAALRSAGVAADCVDEIEIALSEACTNVFLHATGSTRYETLVDLDEHEIVVSVLDSGSGGVAPRRPEQPAPGSPAENGRGLELMAALTDRVAFDFDGGSGASVLLAKRLRWAEDAPLRCG